MDNEGAWPRARRLISVNGWLIVDKPPGLTSAQVVGIVRRCLREGGHGAPPVGHGGTLDPLATGVLPVAIGEATKLTGRMLNGDKAYRFTIRFGTATDTDDAEGAVTASSKRRPDRDAIVAMLPRFTGTIQQRPPAYSAIKIDGRRAYALARAGDVVEMAERAVRIDALTLTACDGDTATLEVACGKGTYVRSLARDIALAAGTVGHVNVLRRTRAGPFSLVDAVALDRQPDGRYGAPLEQALPLTAGLADIPAFAVDHGQATDLRAGRTLPGPYLPPGLHVATLGPVPVALVEQSAAAVRVVRGFNL